MYKNLLILIFIVLVSVGFAQDTLYSSISGDTLTIHHESTHRNCAALFTWDVNIVDNLITITEVDTGGQAWCMCYFDLEVSLTGLDPGSYQIDVWSNDIGLDPAYHGSIYLDWGTGLTGQERSDCLAFREDDTTFIELSVLDDTLNLFWDTPLLNCALEPTWQSWIAADTFHLVMIDTGMAADCICPFEISAAFAPFTAGTYTLDFWNGEYGYPQFTIGSLREDPELLGGYQSPCYDAVAITHEPVHQIPNTALLDVDIYPNPFNSEVKISYVLTQDVDLGIQIFNIHGSLVYRVNEAKSVSAGVYDRVWNGRDESGEALDSGIYFIAFKSGSVIHVERLVLLK